MSKIRGFQCDRCNRFYEKNKCLNQRNESTFNLIGFAFVNTAKQLDRYDLCDECIKQLQNWVDGAELPED